MIVPAATAWWLTVHHAVAPVLRAIRSATDAPIQNATGKCARTGCSGCRCGDRIQAIRFRTPASRSRKPTTATEACTTTSAGRDGLLLGVEAEGDEEAAERCDQKQPERPLRRTRRVVHEHRDGEHHETGGTEQAVQHGARDRREPTLEHGERHGETDYGGNGKGQDADPRKGHDGAPLFIQVTTCMLVIARQAREHNPTLAKAGARARPGES